MLINGLARRGGTLVVLSISLALGSCNETSSAGGAPPDASISEVPNSGEFASATTGHNIGIPQSDYRIGPLDVLEVTFFQVKDLDRTTQVSGSGTITLSLIGEVKASGKTVMELERDIAARFGAKYLRAPDVHVSVKEYTSQRYTIEGAVNGAGVFSMFGRTSLLQGIAMARGTTRIAESTVLIFRTVDNKRVAARYDVAAIRAGQAEDPMLEAGDIVVVGESAVRSALADVLQVLPAATLFRPF